MITEILRETAHLNLFHKIIYTEANYENYHQYRRLHCPGG